MKVMDSVPCIVGLERFLDPILDLVAIDQQTRDFLKEIGASCAAIGAVCLYHVQDITPEAIEQGKGLLKPDYTTFVIDADYLTDMFASYPVMFRSLGAAPKMLNWLRTPVIS